MQRRTQATVIAFPFGNGATGFIVVMRLEKVIAGGVEITQPRMHPGSRFWVCGQFGDSERLLQPVQRFVDGIAPKGQMAQRAVGGGQTDGVAILFLRHSSPLGQFFRLLPLAPVAILLGELSPDARQPETIAQRLVIGRGGSVMVRGRDPMALAVTQTAQPVVGLRQHRRIAQMLGGVERQR